MIKLPMSQSKKTADPKIINSNFQQIRSRFKSQKLNSIMAKFRISPLSWILVVLVFTLSIFIGLVYLNKKEAVDKNNQLQKQLSETTQTLQQKETKITNLLARDEYQTNVQLQQEIASVEAAFSQAVDTYEELIKLKSQTDVEPQVDQQWAKTLSLLSASKYASAQAQLKDVNQKINTIRQELIASQNKQQTTLDKQVEEGSVSPNNELPASGYSRQKVTTSAGTFIVDITAGNLESTKIIVDTASEKDCTSNCPVLPLATYVQRNNAYAGINGSYFCPASYPSCAGKENSFDTLLMNKNKVYFNSDNNVYSTVPAVIFGNGFIRFVSQSQQWGRDTSVDSVIANQPLLVSGGQSVFAGDGDPKKGSRAGRSFIANKGNTAYIGVVHNATVTQSSLVLATLGVDNAINLDSGGSTAFWHGGYKVGPGRNIPNAILLVRK